VYYANGIYSIASAARYYFDKDISDLNYAQAALLISIPPSPTYFNPLTHPMNVKKRQQIVMNSLIQEKKITKEEAERQTSNMWNIIQTKLVNGDYYNNRQRSLDLAPYFSEYIRRQLYPKYGDKLYTNGYKIYTTLNLELQKTADKTIKQHLNMASQSFKNTSLYNYKAIRKNLTASNPGQPLASEFLSLALGAPMPFSLGLKEEEVLTDLNKTDTYALNMVLNTFGMNGLAEMVNQVIQKKNNVDLETDGLEVAFVSTEPATGRIIAMVGGSGFSSHNQINRVYQTKRQPGSTFKPFLYLSALNTARFTAATTFEDKPIAFQLSEGDIWIPGNASKHYNGEITLRNALKKSLNIISIRLIQAMGIPQAANFISQFLGIKKERLRIDSSLALGTSELTPLEVNKGYAQIANGGRSIIPHAIIEIKNRYNQTIDFTEQQILNVPQTQLDDPRYNYIVISMMKDVMRGGSGAPLARAMNFQPPNIAGKTGTTSNMTDAWFSGFSPDITATVWIGFDRRASLGTSAFGGVIAEPIWIDYMKEAVKNYLYKDFEEPPGIVTIPIHSENGKLLPDNCLNSPQRLNEFFTEETKPTEYSPYCGQKSQEDIENNAQKLDNVDIFASINN
jgi:penicillin-binding protein 1A